LLWSSSTYTTSTVPAPPKKKQKKIKKTNNTPTMGIAVHVALDTLGKDDTAEEARWAARRVVLERELAQLQAANTGVLLH